MNDWRYICEVFYDGNMEKMIQHMEKSHEVAKKRFDLKFATRLNEDIYTCKLILKESKEGAKTW